MLFVLLLTRESRVFEMLKFFFKNIEQVTILLSRINVLNESTFFIPLNNSRCFLKLY